MIKYIGQHIFDFIARFRNDIYLENIADGTVDSDKFLGLDSSGKVVKETVVSSSGDITGVDITVGTGLDISQSNTTSGDYSSTINLDLTEVGVSGSANQILTDDGDGTITSESTFTYNSTDGLSITDSNGGLTWDKEILTIEHNGTNDPGLKIKSTAGSAHIGGVLQFITDEGNAGASGDILGRIEFVGDNADQDTPQQTYAKIFGKVDVATDGQESGILELQVANHDDDLGTGLTLTGGSQNDEIDVTVGLGSASTTTIAGDLSVTTGLILDSVDVTTIQTSAESFADNDTSLMTSAAIDDRINAAGGSGISFDGSTADGVLTYKDSDEATVEANLTFSSETLSIGADDTGVANIVRAQRSSTGNGGDLVVSGGNPDSGETNKVGGDLALDGGKGTGSGAGGHVKIKTYAAGSSGTSFNTSPTIWQFHDTGEFETPGEIELGHASDTTLARSAAGRVTIEGEEIVTTRTPALTSAAAGIPCAIMQVRRTITQAEANSMHSTPIEIVPAQGANTVIVPLGGMVRVDRATTQLQSACDWNMHYADQEPGTYGTASIQHFRRFMYGETGDRVLHITPGFAATEVAQNLTDDVNKAVEVSFDSAATTNAFTSIDVYLTYQVISIA